MPDSIISSAASRVPARTNSGVTVLASAGKMYFCSQSISARSSASPRKRTIGAWVWVLTRPGMITPPAASTVSRAAEVGRDGGCRIDRHDVTTLDRHCPALDDPPIGVDGHDNPVGHDQRNRAGGGAWAAETATIAAANSDERPKHEARFYTPRHPSGMRQSPFANRHSAMYSPSVSVHVVEHPLVHDALVTLRDARTPPEEFRRMAVRISLLLAAEATRDLPASSVTVQTPLGPAEGRRVSADVVVVPVLRAGLGMLDAILELMPNARVGHIGLQRDESTAIASQYYSKLPKGLGEQRRAHDRSHAGDRRQRRRGTGPPHPGGRARHPHDLHRCRPEGVELVQKHHPGVRIYTPAIDRQLNDHKYIVPGLGDFGDRLYGTL